VVDRIVMQERMPQTKRIDEKTFTVVRKGYDPREVKTYMEELEHAFQDLEGHARRTSQKVVELQQDLKAARATERASLDNAMMAVFDVKDRMLDRAERRAREIQDEAGKSATSLLAEVEAARGREPELERRISGLEHELMRSRADGERLRMQLEDAHATIDRLETTTTVDITSIQAQLQQERSRNAELAAAAREYDYVRREYEEKLARAQQAAMIARAELEAVKATQSSELEPAETATGTVVYERRDYLEDLEMFAQTDQERLSEAI
jgi:cell division septum initiation protein DivIVA